MSILSDTTSLYFMVSSFKYLFFLLELLKCISCGLSSSLPFPLLLLVLCYLSPDIHSCNKYSQIAYSGPGVWNRDKQDIGNTLKNAMLINGIAFATNAVKLILMHWRNLGGIEYNWNQET